MKLMEIIEKKLKEREEKIHTPSPDDKVVNDLADYGKDIAKKREKYNVDVDNRVYAYQKEGAPVLLREVDFNDVDFIGGVWRVQEPFDARGYQMVEIRDKKFVLLNKLPRQERTKFEFYNAASVNWGAFGLVSDFEPVFIIAKYDTNRGVFYSYRCKLTDPYALENARAHLAGKVLEAYQDLVENEILRSKSRFWYNVLRFNNFSGNIPNTR